MPVNPDLVERVFPPTEPYLIGREKVREFARAVFSDTPAHTDPEAARRLGYADVVAPATFPIVVADRTMQQLLQAEDTGIALERLLHAEQRFAWERPLVAGDELTAQLKVVKVRALGAGTMVTSETTVTDASGAVVVTATSLLLAGEEAA